MYHHPAGPGGGFHQWMSTDGESEDSCIACGVTCPDFGVGIMSDHGTMTLWCPGPIAFNSHHFTGDEHELVCHYCPVVINEHTLPYDVDWECRSDERSPIPEDHPHYVAV